MSGKHVIPKLLELGYIKSFEAVGVKPKKVNVVNEIKREDETKVENEIDTASQ